MDLCRISTRILRCVPQGQMLTVQASSCQPCRCYRPKGLTDQERMRIEKVQKPFVPDPSSPYVQHWQTYPSIVKSYKKKAWAKFGSASGVDIKDILPTKEDIQEEWEAEKRWWPTLQEMQKEVKAEKDAEEQKRLAYEKRVAENMAKMPKWIEQWKDEQTKQKQRDEDAIEKREILKERALEEVNYEMNPDSREFKMYLRDFAERERLAKKKAKKIAKQLKKR